MADDGRVQLWLQLLLAIVCAVEFAAAAGWLPAERWLPGG